MFSVLTSTQLVGCREVGSSELGNVLACGGKYYFQYELSPLLYELDRELGAEVELGKHKKRIALVSPITGKSYAVDAVADPFSVVHSSVLLYYSTRIRSELAQREKAVFDDCRVLILGQDDIYLEGKCLAYYGQDCHGSGSHPVPWVRLLVVSAGDTSYVLYYHNQLFVARLGPLALNIFRDVLDGYSTNLMVVPYDKNKVLVYAEDWICSERTCFVTDGRKYWRIASSVHRECYPGSYYTVWTYDEKERMYKARVPVLKKSAVKALLELGEELLVSAQWLCRHCGH